MTTGDLVCFSHLRWGCVFGRPNHLMVRFARRYRTFFVEEPRLLDAGRRPRLEVRQHPDGPWICVPWVPVGLPPSTLGVVRRELLQDAMREHRIHPRVLWFYTPTAIDVASEIDVPLVVYDCMEDVCADRGAPPESAPCEAELLRRADLVFTGDRQTFRAMRTRHPAVHHFPDDPGDALVTQDREVGTTALAHASWDETFERMLDRMGDAMLQNRRATSVTRRDVGTLSLA